MGKVRGGITSPRPLDSDHVIEGFDCGDGHLNGFLQRAFREQEKGNCVCHVVADAERRVVAFYTLSSHSITRLRSPRKLYQQTTDPAPTVLLGRFAVDQKWQGRGLGADLMRDALQKVASSAQTVGIHAVIVDAKSDSIKGFYEKLGFQAIGDEEDPLRLYLLVADIAKTLAGL